MHEVFLCVVCPKCIGKNIYFPRCRKSTVLIHLPFRKAFFICSVQDTVFKFDHNTISDCMAKPGFSQSEVMLQSSASNYGKYRE